MTEFEWLSCTDPQAMLNLHGRGGPSLSERVRFAWSDRKLRLFACACCRQVWHLLPESSHRAIFAGERIADGIHDAAGWQAIHRDTVAAASPGHLNFAPCYLGPGRDFDLDSVFADRPWPDGSPALHAALLRDIVGNPWRPVRLPPVPPIVLRLAQVIYDTHDFAALPILADALEDTGCDNEDLLTHLRVSGSAGAGHVRGCWALDLVLGKE